MSLSAYQHVPRQIAGQGNNKGKVHRIDDKHELSNITWQRV